MLQSGDIISGMYQVIREIGTGGMGVIYIGYHLHLQKQIVIKKIKETCVDRVNVRGEADILKQLRHTYLPQVYDFLEVGNDVYTVMDISQGKICSIISTIIIHFRKRRFCCGCVSYVRFWTIFIRENHESFTATLSRQILW